MSVQWMKKDKDTIAAIATPHGDGGIGVIRLSGNEALPILNRLFQPKYAFDSWHSHRMVFGACKDSKGELLDEVLAVWMKQGHSFTGEHVVEIHAHGGHLNLLQILREACQQGARPAEAGEFSRRAYLNGRMNLTQAESIAELIHAQNERSLRIARQHLQGHLQIRFKSFATRSLELAAQVESWIDFPEEFDPALEESVRDIFQNIESFQKDVHDLLSSYEQGKRIREGWSIALIGKPNVGKSSLFNQIHGENKAIVTSLPGTTRDVLETSLAFEGIHFVLKDCAGIRHLPTQSRQSLSPQNTLEQHYAIEKLGMERAFKSAEEANLILLVLDGSKPWSEEDQIVFNACQKNPKMLVVNKNDQPTKLQLPSTISQDPRCIEVAYVSCLSQEGLSDLKTRIKGYIEQQTPPHELIITNERHRDSLEKALHYLNKALQEGATLGPEFMADDLRASRQALVELTGDVSNEDVLNTIFSRFCIGK